jgi:molybdopterin-guanine dinucleotide biosynthesis protein A
MSRAAPAPVAVTGIVLAGGRSSRFGSDKLEARVDGERLLDRSVAALARVASEIVLVSEPSPVRAAPSRPGVPVHLVEDPEPFGGPLVGLLAGLEAASEPLVLVVGGDMPSLNADVLRLLVTRLVHHPDRSVVTLAARGRLVPLPMALRTGAATDMARRLLGDGERRLRGLAERLPAVVVDEREWRPLDPDGDTLRDVDRPEDLPDR